LFILQQFFQALSIIILPGGPGPYRDQGRALRRQPHQSHGNPALAFGTPKLKIYLRDSHPLANRGECTDFFRRFSAQVFVGIVARTLVEALKSKVELNEANS